MKRFISSKKHELQLLEDEKENCEDTVELQQFAIANLFVTKRRGRPPKRLKDALENLTNTYQNFQNSKSMDNNNEQ
ncbi:19362_t:CDS:1, partial [Gigaspora rosea]